MALVHYSQLSTVRHSVEFILFRITVIKCFRLKLCTPRYPSHDIIGVSHTSVHPRDHCCFRRIENYTALYFIIIFEIKANIDLQH